MAVSYKKLWKILIDRDMTKTAMRKEAGISTAALAKLGKNENINTEVLVKICAALHCDISDIMEITEGA
jgi:DNA-binding Xre family transcriptional regulator